MSAILAILAISSTAALGAAAPPALPAMPGADCTCGIIRAVGSPPPPPVWSERPAVMIATVMRIETPGGSIRQRVRLLVEASWKGVREDTITLDVNEDSPCGEYVAGSRYLVLADTATVDGQRMLRSWPCDEPWSTAAPRAQQLVESLGPPSHRRHGIPIENAVRLGAPMPIAADTMHVGLHFVDRSRIASVRIADQALTQKDGMFSTKAPRGTYEVQVAHVDGRAFNMWVMVECDPQFKEFCMVFRYLRGYEFEVPTAKQ